MFIIGNRFIFCFVSVCVFYCSGQFLPDKKISCGVEFRQQPGLNDNPD